MARPERALRSVHWLAELKGPRAWRLIEDADVHRRDGSVAPSTNEKRAARYCAGGAVILDVLATWKEEIDHYG